ncbi:S8 family serine peptidase [Streptomyces sp. TBY4]|uniref:S8 family peptidase n=1 Tax=Streptomyces sp. TBY4 TaxID=2962030 RepID=UPI0020B76A01|nr:S8 family serine peptidase [Streptomyces sp. TBY4]MCP3757200.1 S8 family serine peptidase [Streptomyces sp. TBY4]
MRNHHARARAAAIAAAAALALAAGLTTPAAAAPGTDLSGTRSETAPSATRSATTRVTLVTGDRVVLAADGRPVSLERAAGRARIPFSVHTENGRTSVVPYDAQPLLRAGKLDPRLFDVTELSRPEYRTGPSARLQLIIGYEGPATAARSALRAAGGVEVTRSYPTLDAEAVSAAPGEAAALWEALTDPLADPGRAAVGRSAAPGIAAVWLDAVHTATLDRSTRQIGADKAWAAGYDGTGVKIAVLDTGIDSTHADLAGQVVAEQNFSASADTVDRAGHGTHVASIAAGTGARSGGTFKGVAPGAKLLNGKVLGDRGSGRTSGILAGMEWAVAQGADIVNLSLGGPDTPQTDPLEAAVDRLSATGVLFTVSAGNSGRRGPGSVNSPGGADAALTVGAVDDTEVLAPFSSTGPRPVDGAVKPDVTAPGVDITAAAAPGSLLVRENGEGPAGHLTLSGTSMAAPHAAGAAALLKQRHPQWKGAELKGALTGSAEGGAYTPYQQGTGRIAVGAALGQSVVAQEPSLAFGTQRWPHGDDTPQTRTITYRNLAAAPVTLDLAVTASGPDGKPAPEGFFTLGDRRLTVPAGGTAQTSLTVDTRLGGTADGIYSAYTTARAEGQSVRTGAVVEREVESYDLTLRHTGRDGLPAAGHSTTVQGVRGGAPARRFDAYDPSGTATLRVPKGGYLLDSVITADPLDATLGADWIAQPRLDVTADTTVDLDARTTRPVDITVPSKTATAGFVAPSYTLREAGAEYAFGFWLESLTGFRSRQLGPAPAAGTLGQQWDVHWTDGPDAEYHAVLGGPVAELATGYTRHLKPRDLATLKVGMGASAPGKDGLLTAAGNLPGSLGSTTTSVPRPLPTTTSVYVTTGDGVTWDLTFTQISGREGEGLPVEEAAYAAQSGRTFTGGRTYHERFAAPVLAPRVDADHGIVRDGATISGTVPLLADGANHAGGFHEATGSTVLRRDGAEAGRSDAPLDRSDPFTVPAGDAAYELTTTTRLRPGLSGTSTEVAATWWFRSKETAGPTALPVSVVRFGARTGLDGTLPAGRTATFPVTVQGPAAAHPRSLRAEVSYDEGRTWRPLRIRDGEVSVRTPAAGGTVSLRGTVTDRSGNRAEVTVLRAYLAG